MLEEIKLTKLEKLDFWLYDKIFLYRWIQRVYGFLRPSILKCKIKRFWQRRTRGWDDSETWNLDENILKYVSSRLRRFAAISQTYPDNYRKYEDWYKELVEQCDKIDLLLDNWYSKFDYKSSKYKKPVKCVEAFHKDLKEVIVWFAENLTNLWW